MKLKLVPKNSNLRKLPNLAQTASPSSFSQNITASIIEIFRVEKNKNCRMSFGPKNSTTGVKMSTWTPKSNSEASAQMFEERKELVTKWWAKWNGHQRAQVMQNLIGVCTNKQIR